MLSRLPALALALLLAGCGGRWGALLPALGPEAPADAVAALWRTDGPVTVEGRLQGPASVPGRCRLLYPAVGEPFALIGATNAFADGARVRVTGPLAIWSACETYRTLRVDAIQPAP